MDLTATLALLRRRWIPMVACIVAGALGALLLSATAPKEYRSSTRLFVSIPAARGVQEALQGVQLSVNLLESYAEIAESRSVAQRASELLEGQLTPGEIGGRVAATPQPNTLLIDISARDSDPITARDAANATAAATIEVINQLEADKEGAVALRVIDPAMTPSTPVSPKPLTDTVVGIVLGLMAGLALALVLEATDRSLSTPGAVTAALGVPVLASVPRHKAIDAHPLVALDGPASPGGEAYRTLRTAVRFVDADAPARTLLVTSPESGEGKTTTAANLAIAFASAGERVIVIDADLRKPRLAEMFDVAPEVGVTSAVFGNASLDDALVTVRDRLLVLPPGPLPPNPSEVLGSQAMADLLDECARRADLVILDAPPVLAVTDAVVLAAMVDAVVLVTQWAKTTEPAAGEARMTLEPVNARVIGAVLNGVRGRRMRRYYRGYVNDSSPLIPFSPRKRSA